MLHGKYVKKCWKYCFIKRINKSSNLAYSLMLPFAMLECRSHKLRISPQNFPGPGRKPSRPSPDISPSVKLIQTGIFYERAYFMNEPKVPKSKTNSPRRSSFLAPKIEHKGIAHGFRFWHKREPKHSQLTGTSRSERWDTFLAFYGMYYFHN